jgi:hypothetical protein
MTTTFPVVGDNRVAENFQHVLATADGVLAGISEENANQSWRPGGWTRKQILGHLCDSALNNRVRIVRAILNGHYEGPEYEQNKWVELHGYHELPWSDLFQLWRLENQLLGRALANAPVSAFVASVSIGDAHMSLEAWVQDYLGHLIHHIEQIGKGS